MVGIVSSASMYWDTLGCEYVASALDTSRVQSGNPHHFPLQKEEEEEDKIAVQLKYWCATKKIVNCDAPKGTTRKKKKNGTKFDKSHDLF